MSEEEIRLDQTKRVFDTLAELISKNETCTYRYLIYDLLGFSSENYAELMSGLTITNALVDMEELQQKVEQLENIRKEAIEEINHELKGHILLNDEESWNDEFYTNGKLDYKKLLIALLTNLLNILNKGSESNE